MTTTNSTRGAPPEQHVEARPCKVEIEGEAEVDDAGDDGGGDVDDEELDAWGAA